MKIEEKGTVHERIEKLIYHFTKGNRTAFGKETDILPGVLSSIVSGRLSKPSFEALQKILTGYPSINPTWLLFGQGPMLVGEVAPSLEPAAMEYNPQPFTSDVANEILVMVKQAVSEQVKQIISGQQLMRIQFNEQVLLSRGEDINWLNQEAQSIKTRKASMAGQVSEADEARLVMIEDAIALLKKSDLENDGLLHPLSYSIDSELIDNKPFSGSLAKRLGVSEDVARRLVTEHKIASIHIGGQGYNISEKSVRQYLGSQH